MFTFTSSVWFKYRTCNFLILSKAGHLFRPTNCQSFRRRKLLQSVQRSSGTGCHCNRSLPSCRICLPVRFLERVYPRNEQNRNSGSLHHQFPAVVFWLCDILSAARILSVVISKMDQLQESQSIIETWRAASHNHTRFQSSSLERQSHEQLAVGSSVSRIASNKIREISSYSLHGFQEDSSSRLTSVQW